MKLFAVYVGGCIEGGHVEIHDVRFVIGEDIEDTYTQLREQWIGELESLHIDAYMEIKNIDGYKISISKNKCEEKNKLYFVFMGAYDSSVFGELHELGFYIGTDEVSVKERALNELCKGSALPHKDNLYDVDSIVEISNLGEYFVNLEYTGEETQKIIPDWFGYNIDVQK